MTQCLLSHGGGGRTTMKSMAEAQHMTHSLVLLKLIRWDGLISLPPIKLLNHPLLRTLTYEELFSVALPGSLTWKRIVEIYELEHQCPFTQESNNSPST